MKVYIRSTGNISPQHSLDADLFFRERVIPATDRLRCIEPEYDRFVDAKMIRRMSRIVKMGVAAAMTCLRNAGVGQPAAIITATAYGCLEDTSSFLRRMIEFQEKMLSPTAFIQSTHNTVGAQIALLLRCNAYNNTIVHRAFSFENALTESILLLAENTGPVLVGAVDENTEDRHAILRRFGLYRLAAATSGISVEKDSIIGQIAKEGPIGDGTGQESARNDAGEGLIGKVAGEEFVGKVAGEGAAFFLLDKEPGIDPLAVLKGLQTLYKPASQAALERSVTDFLAQNEITMPDVGLVLSSVTDHPSTKETARALAASVFRGKPIFPFKSLCGDYPTASGFSLWLASTLLKTQRAPEWMKGLRFPIRNILIHHHNGNDHHSLFLISRI